jgi:hypothetical protein
VSRLSSGSWITAVSSAPAGSGALLAWISGDTGSATVTVSIGTL